MMEKMVNQRMVNHLFVATKNLRVIMIKTDT